MGVADDARALFTGSTTSYYSTGAREYQLRTVRASVTARVVAPKVAHGESLGQVETLMCTLGSTRILRGTRKTDHFLHGGGTSGCSLLSQVSTYPLPLVLPILREG